MGLKVSSSALEKTNSHAFSMSISSDQTYKNKPSQGYRQGHPDAQVSMAIKGNSLCHGGLGHHEKKDKTFFVSVQGVACLPWTEVSLTYIEDGVVRQSLRT